MKNVNQIDNKNITFSREDVDNSREFVNNSRAALSFLRDIARSPVLYDDAVTDVGREGFACILDLISNELDLAVNLLEGRY